MRPEYVATFDLALKLEHQRRRCCHVSHRGNTGFDSDAGVVFSPLDAAFVGNLQIRSARSISTVQKKMDVTIDQAGTQVETRSIDFPRKVLVRRFLHG